MLACDVMLANISKFREQGSLSGDHEQDSDIAQFEKDLSKNAHIQSVKDKGKRLAESSETEEFVTFARETFASMYRLLAINKEYRMAVESCHHSQIQVRCQAGS